MNNLRVLSEVRVWIQAHKQYQLSIRNAVLSPKLCGHLCAMGNFVPKCCACVDKRPLNDNYIRYVDGRGSGMDGIRRMHYCPFCKHATILYNMTWQPELNNSFPRYFQNMAISIASMHRYGNSPFYRLPIEVVYLIISMVNNDLIHDLMNM